MKKKGKFRTDVSWMTGLGALAWLASAGPLLAGPSAIGIRFEKTLDFAAEQSAELAEEVLSGNRERFVNYTTASGNWRTQTDRTWTSGFVPGVFWYLYDLSGDPLWRDDAMHWTEGVRSRATATDNDTSFQVFSSFGLGYGMTGESNADYKEVILTAAETVSTERYNETIGAYRSWGQGGDGVSNPTALPFEVIIDQMMNLELQLWAGYNGGPVAYIDEAIRHADKTWENNVREDGGTYHVVAYNLDGSVAYKRTHQGWREESTWSRGQAWAVYGYTMVYRYTGLERMLERARICYDYFMAETLKGSPDYIAYSDFDAPLDSRNPRDTSASAIVAAAALELYEMTGERHFLEDAEAILDSLSSPRYLARGSRYDSILLKASEKWGQPEVGAIFADFYFLEALYRYEQLELPEAVVTGSWAGYDILDGAFVDTGSWMGWTRYREAPFLYNYTFEGWLYEAPGTTGTTGGWFFSYRP